MKVRQIYISEAKLHMYVFRIVYTFTPFLKGLQLWGLEITYSW